MIYKSTYSQMTSREFFVLFSQTRRAVLEMLKRLFRTGDGIVNMQEKEETKIKTTPLNEKKCHDGYEDNYFPKRKF